MSPSCRRPTEVFALTCWACGRDIEVPTLSPTRCPICTATLSIQWRPDEQPAATAAKEGAYERRMNDRIAEQVEPL
jgi:hypothetical protein